MPFDPKSKLRSIQGRDYLDVKWRLVWFREDHPHGSIETSFQSVGEIVIATCRVSSAEGHLLATGSATVRDATEREKTWAGRIIEKAETAAQGRALAAAGYGTQFDDDDGEHLADSPVEQQRKPAPPPPPRPRSPFSSANATTPSPDEEPAESGSDVVNTVRTEMTKNGKLRIVAAGASAITRQPFTDAGLDTDDWANPGEHALGRDVRVFWRYDGAYKNISHVELISASIPF